MLEISTAFPNSSESVLSFLRSAGKGFYIPLYQRQYSWSDDNIDQLMESIFWGVKELLSDENAIRFMGTIILFQEQDRDNNIKPQDRRALPNRIDNVIDGQQRISTIAILASQLYFRLHEKKTFFEKKQEDYFKDLCVDINTKLKELLELFSVDLQRGNPERKPIIIRGSIDQWTLNGDDEVNYKSDVSALLAKSIRKIESKDFSIENRRRGNKNLVESNVDLINKHLDKIDDLHQEEDILPSAGEIVSSIKQEHIWSYDREEIVKLIKKEISIDSKSYDQLCSTVRLLAFIHYLCKRSCFTLIEPRSENWAFDMFQSLNATGTPLTAIETFKPLVVNDFDHVSEQSYFKDSEVESYFNNVESYIDGKNIKQKEKVTSEYLTTFSLCYDGNREGMTTQFSSQRAWLNRAYAPNKKGIDEKQDFVRKMSDVALFLRDVINFDPEEQPYINSLNELTKSDKDIIALNCLFLRDSNHKMSYTILALFYSRILRKVPNSQKDFLEATKIIASFYSIWRSCSSNVGLDEVYRKLLKGSEEVKGIAWSSGSDNLNITFIRNYFNKALCDKQSVTNYDSWFRLSKNNLRFKKANSICRYALLFYAHETIPDENNIFLAKKGMPGINSYLTPVHWVSKKLKTIEHIAPQSNKEGWDVNIYNEDSIHKVGNLTLLPIVINSSLSNRPWKEKIIYYRHLAETDPDKIEALKKDAEEINLDLDPKKIEILQSAQFNDHIRPLVINTENIEWSNKTIDDRTESICKLFWERTSPLLGF
jgi:hypothetical protein